MRDQLILRRQQRPDLRDQLSDAPLVLVGNEGSVIDDGKSTRLPAVGSGGQTAKNEGQHMR